MAYHEPHLSETQPVHTHDVKGVRECPVAHRPQHRTAIQEVRKRVQSLRAKFERKASPDRVACRTPGLTSGKAWLELGLGHLAEKTRQAYGIESVGRDEG